MDSEAFGNEISSVEAVKQIPFSAQSDVNMKKTFGMDEATEFTEPNLKSKSGISLEDSKVHDLESQQLAPAGEASWAGGVMNLVKCMIGAGILALPHAYAQCGWGVGIFTLVYGGYTTYMSMVLLTRCCAWLAENHNNGVPSSFGKLCSVLYPNWAWIVDILVLLLCFGSGLSYIIIISNLLPPVAQKLGAAADSFVVNRLFLMSIVFAVIDIPLSCLRNISSLSYTSGAAIVCLIYVVILAMLFLINPKGADEIDPCINIGPGGVCRGVSVAVTTGIGFIRALPTFIFSFSGSFIIFPIYDSLKNQTCSVMENQVVIPSLVLAFFIYGGFGLFGYFTYGTMVNSNILTNFPPTKPVTAARILMSLVVAVTYPMYVQSMRNCLFNIGNFYYEKKGQPDKLKGVRIDMILHWCLSLLILFATYIICVFISNLSVVVNLVGIITGVPLGYILPGIFYLQIFFFDRRKNNPEYVNTWYDIVLYLYALWMFLFGCVFLPLALAYAFN